MRCDTRLLTLALLVMPLVVAEFSAAQIRGIPPSVTSIQYHTPPFMPNIPPSVTSLGPQGYGNGQFPPVWWPFPRYGVGNGFGVGHGRGNGFGNKKNSGYSNGAAFFPIFVPAYDGSYGYDPGVEGVPYMYSGPPTEQTLHVVVDLPAARRGVAEDDEDGTPPASASTSKRDSDVANVIEAVPIDPTVLVFRDGHQQEVTNYAIVGQTVYVFDKRTQKIALTDLDVAATVKVNDDRGVDFHVPVPTKS